MLLSVSLPLPSAVHLNSCVCVYGCAMFMLLGCTVISGVSEAMLKITELRLVFCLMCPTAKPVDDRDFAS